MTLTLIHGHMGARKQKTSTYISCQSFKLTWMAFRMLFTLFHLMKLILIISCPIYGQGREPNLCDFVRKASILACIQIFTGQFFVQTRYDDTTERYILLTVWVILTFIEGHSCKRHQELLHSFSCKFLDRF